MKMGTIEQIGANPETLFKKLDSIEEKINLLLNKIDDLINNERGRVLYEFYRDVINDYDGELHFLAFVDERVHNYFQKILYQILNK